MPDLYAEPAVRHLDDADHLFDSGHIDGGGYLIGLAVECAIKFAITATRPTAGALHVHLPNLVERAKKPLGGRRPHSLITLLQQANFMHGWNIEIRYAGNGAVSAEQYLRWRSDAKRAMGAAKLKKRNL